MLVHGRSDNGVLELEVGTTLAELVDIAGGVPLLEDVDAIVLERISGQAEGGTAGCCTCCFDDGAAAVQVGLSLLGFDLEPAGHDDHVAPFLSVKGRRLVGLSVGWVR